MATIAMRDDDYSLYRALGIFASADPQAAIREVSRLRDQHGQEIADPSRHCTFQQATRVFQDGARWDVGCRIRICEAAVNECHRSHVGVDRVIDLLDGYQYGYARSDRGRLPDPSTIMRIAGIVEPGSHGTWRHTGATSRAVTTVPARTVPRLMGRLVETLDDEVDADTWISSFLAVRPFSVGNHRTAWVLRTWLTDTWDAPPELPHRSPNASTTR